jgi:predicted metal-dependent enzyme (double-stranded beta helix superfamily)
MRTTLSTLDDILPDLLQRSAHPEERFNLLKVPFEALLREPGVDLTKYSERSPNPYARYLLSDPRRAYQLVLAFWRPGATSPIHNHQKLTGAVGLLQGRLVEENFELTPGLGVQKGAYRVTRREAVEMQVGVANPIYAEGFHQVHRMYNADPEVAVTMHLYLGKLEHIQKYLPQEDGTLTAEDKNLWFDA